MEYDIYLGDPDCDIEDIDTCSSCEKHPDCVDECEPEMCEQCFGEEPPEDCEPMCPEGSMPCMVDDEGGDPCPEGEFCLAGCCVPFMPPP
jgi:hypothetical protein